jgi:hypothetical protein
MSKTAGRSLSKDYFQNEIDILINADHIIVHILPAKRGMSRRFKIIAVNKDSKKLLDFGYTLKNDYFRVRGCGMDMYFAILYDLYNSVLMTDNCGAGNDFYNQIQKKTIFI